MNFILITISVCLLKQNISTPVTYYFKVTTIYLFITKKDKYNSLLQNILIQNQIKYFKNF